MKLKLVSILSIVTIIIIGSIFYFKDSTQVVAYPKIGNVTEAVYGLGKVKSYKRFEVIIGVISTVRKLYVDEGFEVKKGDPLIEFESRPSVRAPFDGTVTMVRTREGETALPQMPVLRMEDLNDRYIELSLEQEAALRIRKNQIAKVSFEALRGQVLEGKVSAIYSREDEFIAQIQVPNLASSVLPGMTADVSVEIGKIKNVTLIPLKAVNAGTVTIKRNGHWKKEKLELGHVDGMFIEVPGNQLKLTDELKMQEGE
ncbi:MAG: efflux RND transporter periplasmic adaptor subunit [Bacteriovoracaceae bacterium]